MFLNCEEYLFSGDPSLVKSLERVTHNSVLFDIVRCALNVTETYLIKAMITQSEHEESWVKILRATYLNNEDTGVMCPVTKTKYLSNLTEKIAQLGRCRSNILDCFCDAWGFSRETKYRVLRHFSQHFGSIRERIFSWKTSQCTTLIVQENGHINTSVAVNCASSTPMLRLRMSNVKPINNVVLVDSYLRLGCQLCVSHWMLMYHNTFCGCHECWDQVRELVMLAPGIIYRALFEEYVTVPLYPEWNGGPVDYEEILRLIPEIKTGLLFVDTITVAEGFHQIKPAVVPSDLGVLFRTVEIALWSVVLCRSLKKEEGAEGDIAQKIIDHFKKKLNDNLHDVPKDIVRMLYENGEPVDTREMLFFLTKFWKIVKPTSILTTQLMNYWVANRGQGYSKYIFILTSRVYSIMNFVFQSIKNDTECMDKNFHFDDNKSFDIVHEFAEGICDTLQGSLILEHVGDSFPSLPAPCPQGCRIVGSSGKRWLMDTLRKLNKNNHVSATLV